MSKNKQILAASKLGANAFLRGLKAACHDKRLMELVTEARPLAQGAATPIELVVAWNQSWQLQRSNGAGT